MPVKMPALPWLGLVVALAASSAAAQEAVERLEIVTGSGAHPLTVEVMRTEPARERGLMFRKSMPHDRGMLFDFKSERPVMMWMKNTYLPLDMIFIGRNGRVVNVAENAEPMSEAIIASDGPVYAVLEINAGEAQEFGVKPGDEVRHPMFKH